MSSEDEALLEPQKNWTKSLLKRFRRPLYAALFLSFLISCFALISPIFVMLTFREISPTAGAQHMGPVMIGVGIYLFAMGRFRSLRSHLISHIGARLSNLVRSQVLRRILLLPPSYTEMASLAAQIARIRDFDSIEEFVTGPAGRAFLEIPFLFILIAGVFVIAGPLGFVPIAALILFVIFGIVMIRVIGLAASSNAKAGKELQDFRVASFANLRSLRSLHLSTIWTQRYQSLLQKSLQGSKRVARLTAMVSSCSYVLTALTGLFMLYLGVERIIAGQLDRAALMASMLLTWRILSPLRSGFMVSVQFNKVRKSIAQIDRLMALPIEEQKERYLRQRSLSGKLKFHQVSLRYAKDAHPALLGVSFEIPSHETLVIIGHGGCGKTTILKLILAMYTPQTGRILLDDLNLRQFDASYLRRSIGYLPERPYFVNGSIRDNLLLANPNPTPEQWDLALGETGLQEDLRRFRNGLDTVINDQEIQGLSTDFLRRLNLAMTLIKGSSLWLLDNPGSGFDDIKERQLLAFLSAARGMATIVIATQNPDYLQVADRALWLNDGRVRAFTRPSEIAEQFKKLVVK